MNARQRTPSPVSWTPRLLAGRQSHYTIVRGIRYHYLELPGAGEDILMLHGLGSSTYTWEHVASRLNALGCHVWALDMKGFGWSDKPRDSRYDPVALMEDVACWMDALGLRRATLVGNSLGAAVASLLALAHPEKASRLVLLDALLPYDIPYPITFRLARLPLAPLLGGWFVTPGGVYRSLKQAFHDSRLVTAQKVRAYYDRLATPNGVFAQIMVTRTLEPAPFRRYMKEVPGMKLDTLVVWGDDDRLIPLRFGHALLRDSGGRGTFVVLRECGHMPQEEKPRETSRLIADFLAGVPVARSPSEAWTVLEEGPRH